MPVPNPVAELLKAVLTLVVAFVLKFVLDAIGYPLDPAVFNALVGAIVTWFLVHFGYGVGNKVAPKLFR